MFTSDKASRVGSLPVTEPELTTDDTEMAELLHFNSKALQINSHVLQMGRTIQHRELQVPSFLRSKHFMIV